MGMFAMKNAERIWKPAVAVHTRSSRAANCRTRAGHRPGDWREPALAEMLADPIIKALMAADGVRPDHLASLLDALIADPSSARAQASLLPSSRKGIHHDAN